MDIVLLLLCIAGLSFALKQVEGPFDLFSKMRNLMFRVPVLGPLMFSVMSCNFCLGLWSSIGLYMFTNFGSWTLVDMLIWGFGGGMFNALFTKVMDKLDIAIK